MVLRTVVVAGLALSLAAPQLARAQGSSVYTHSACMSARNGAGVANPCADGSAVFYNPAALALQPSAVGLNATLVTSETEFTYAGGERAAVRRGPERVTVPAGWLQYRVNPRLAAGLGVWAPYGLGLKWPTEFEGRYMGYDNSLRGLYIQPTVAYQVLPERVSVGAGVDFVRGSISIRQRSDLARLVVVNPATGQPVMHPVVPGTPLTFGHLGVAAGTDFADALLEGDGSAVTGHAGLMARLTDRLSLGARYMHSATVAFEGTGTFQQVETNIVLPGALLGRPEPQLPLDAVLATQFTGTGLLTTQTIQTELTFPAMAVIGLSFGATPQLQLMADYQWTGWSSFDRAPVEFERLPDDVLVFEYSDAHTYRLGADFAATPALDLRAGFVYNTAASPMPSPLLPEAPRNYYSVGLGYRFLERATVDLMYMLVRQADRPGRVRPGGEPIGVYASDSYLLGLTLSWQFGPQAR
jgi:long-chain fatty acid transport protein